MHSRLVRVLAAFAMAGCSVVAAPEGPVGARTRTGDVPPAEAAGAPAARRVGAEAGPTRRFEEVRGLWVVRSTLTSERGIRAMVADAEAGGINTLLVQVRGRGDAYYRSRWEPRAELIGDPDLDPLDLVIREAHARGIAVHAWVNTHLVWSGPTLPASPLHMVNERPDWLAVPRSLARRLRQVDPWDPSYARALQRYALQNPATVEGMYSSPSHPGVQERVVAVWMDLAERYELDGIHFDYVRYPSGDFDYSAGSLERFRSWLRPRLPAERFALLDDQYRSDPFAFTDALPEAWSEFRREQITGLVERVYRGVKERRPDLVVSAAVFSNAQDAYGARFQDWRRWLDAGILDVVVPMAYTPVNGVFTRQVREATVSAGKRDRVWAGIGAYQNGLDGTLDKIDIARKEGVGGMVLFSYDWAVTEGGRVGGVPFLRNVGRARFEGDAVAVDAGRD